MSLSSLVLILLRIPYMDWVKFFFFQAEDGIRDGTVTGVQTCALPICDGAEDAHTAPGDGEGGADDLRVVLLGDEAAPRLHEPAVVDVLRPAERLTRAGAELTLEEVAEGLLHDVADLREVALADATDLDLGKTSLRVQPGAVDRGPHADKPARSSSRVITPEWSRPPRPFTRSALNSSCTTAVAGSGTPRTRADSMMRPRSLKCRSILKPGL